MREQDARCTAEGCTFSHTYGSAIELRDSAQVLALPAFPLGPLGFEGAQHRQTLRPSVVGIRSKALRPFGLQ